MLTSRRLLLRSGSALLNAPAPTPIPISAFIRTGTRGVSRLTRPHINIGRPGTSIPRNVNSSTRAISGAGNTPTMAATPSFSDAVVGAMRNLCVPPDAPLDIYLFIIETRFANHGMR